MAVPEIVRRARTLRARRSEYHRLYCEIERLSDRELHERGKTR